MQGADLAQDPRFAGYARAALPLGASLVTAEGRTTHVMIPVDEYERMAAARIVREAEAILEDPEMEWVDLEDVVAKRNVERIVKARKSRGLTQAQLGKLVGMPQSQISRLEKNPDASSLRLIKKVAKALKIPASELV